MFALVKAVPLPCQTIITVIIMKALIIIASCIALSFLFKVIETFTSRKRINSVGAKSNNLSKDMPRIDIRDEKQLNKALDHYKNMID